MHNKNFTLPSYFAIFVNASGLYSNPETQVVESLPQEGTSVFNYSKQEISRYKCNPNACEIENSIFITYKEDYMKKENVKMNKEGLLDSGIFRRIVLTLMIISTVIINLDYIRNRDSGKAYLLPI
jgi:hypothetical protein